MKMPAEVHAELVAGVDLLCLDAGNTVIFLDHARLARLVTQVAQVAGRSFDPFDASALIRTEGEAKQLAETGGLYDCDWTFRQLPGASAWGRMVGTIALRAGLDVSLVPTLLDRAWRTHEQKNFWCKVPEGLGDALDRVRAIGVKVAIISNSEGMLDRLFRDLGILGHFDLVVDSGKVGFEKPDPRIFQVAFDHFATRPEHAIHLGDVFATDVLGARAAGCRYALIDPFGHYEGRHLDMPRVPGAVEVANAITDSRRSSSGAS